MQRMRGASLRAQNLRLRQFEHFADCAPNSRNSWQSCVLAERDVARLLQRIARVQMTETSRLSTTQTERIQSKILSTAFAVATIGMLMCPGCGSDAGSQSATGGQAQAGSPESTAGESGQGGGSITLSCPSNIVAADGESCAEFPEGFKCSDGGTNPCQFGNAIVCVNGVWQRRESFPAPCAGDGVGRG